MSEKSLHLAVCDYLRLQYPGVMFNTDLSGIRLTIGQARMAKMMRSMKGYPDLVLYEPRGPFHGLFLELKKEGEKVFNKHGIPIGDHAKEQFQVMLQLRKKGYAAMFSVGFDAAKAAIDEYLKLR